MNPLLNIAIQAARKAGDVIVRHIDRVDTINISEKDKNDFVTEIDHLAEQEAIKVIQKAHPDHSILAEESGEIKANESEFLWIIDPLDGTVNYIHGFPHFCVSIGLQYKGKIEHGVVYDPLRMEIFKASRGEGARLNEKRIRVSEQKKLHGSLLGTGFPIKQPQHLKPFVNIFQSLLPETAGVRRAGSAALDLAYVACGRLDGYWEFSLYPWDMAAGALLVKEAGGLVGDLHGKENYLETGNIVAGTPRIYKELLEHIEDGLEE